MPIPDLTDEGVLPPGIHDCTFEEVERRFSGPQRSRRRLLWEEFRTYYVAVTKAEIGVELIVAGSFITATSEPNDVDLLLVVPAAHDIRGRIRPDQYNVVSRARVTRRLNMDLLVAPKGSERHVELVELFQRSKTRRELRKGILRIIL